MSPSSDPATRFASLALEVESAEWVRGPSALPMPEDAQEAADALWGASDLYRAGLLSAASRAAVRADAALRRIGWPTDVGELVAVPA